MTPVEQVPARRTVLVWLFSAWFVAVGAIRLVFALVGPLLLLVEGESLDMTLWDWLGHVGYIVWALIEVNTGIALFRLRWIAVPLVIANVIAAFSAVSLHSLPALVQAIAAGDSWDVILLILAISGIWAVIPPVAALVYVWLLRRRQVFQ